MTEHQAVTAPQRAYRAPFLGADVFYIAYGSPGEYPAGVFRTARITQAYRQPGGSTHPTRVDLVVFNPTGFHFPAHVEYDPQARRPGHWCWPDDAPPQNGL